MEPYATLHFIFKQNICVSFVVYCFNWENVVCRSCSRSRRTRGSATEVCRRRSKTWGREETKTRRVEERAGCAGSERQEKGWWCPNVDAVGILRETKEKRRAPQALFYPVFFPTVGRRRAKNSPRRSCPCRSAVGVGKTNRVAETIRWPTKAGTNACAVVKTIWGEVET